MDELSLNERSYLADIIHKQRQDIPSDKIWDLTEVISRKQRNLIVALKLNKKSEELKEVIENIINYQSHVKQAK